MTCGVRGGTPTCWEERSGRGEEMRRLGGESGDLEREEGAFWKDNEGAFGKGRKRRLGGGERSDGDVRGGGEMVVLGSWRRYGLEGKTRDDFKEKRMCGGSEKAVVRGRNEASWQEDKKNDLVGEEGATKKEMSGIYREQGSRKGKSEVRNECVV